MGWHSAGYLCLDDPGKRGLWQTASAGTAWYRQMDRSEAPAVAGYHFYDPMDALVLCIVVWLGDLPDPVHGALYQYRQRDWGWNLGWPLLLAEAAAGGAWRSALVLLLDVDPIV